MIHVGWYDILWFAGKFAVGIASGAAAGTVTHFAVRSIERRPPSQTAGTERKERQKARSLRILIVLLVGVAGGVGSVTLLDRANERVVEVVQPMNGQIVHGTFFAKGSVGRPRSGERVYLLVHDPVPGGAPWIVSDVWPPGENGWWQGMGRVPPSVLYGGSVWVVAFRTTDSDFRVGQEFATLPGIGAKGGISNVVTVNYIGP